MTSNEIRKTFLNFFEGKNHKIVSSAPIVIKNDPTLMFTNAGMNQFKDLFLGNAEAQYKRIADTQKCLRVSGKHNDLEDVGIDTYHHTMFEMIGNWSFGDYFKKEAIDWAWELITEVYKIEKDRLYVSVFEGSSQDGLEMDQEAYELWLNHVEKDRIILGNKKDNFWEMGDTGPCGPCSEIHVDLRPDNERAETPGKSLVNADHPQVIEIWNLVFMEFNRTTDGKLHPLPQKHVDTGMGFERLCRVIEKKTSNYDTGVFMPIINEIERLSGKKYGEDEKTDIAFRVVADHIRAITFTIGDGQLPSNNKAGYVVRRILRRAVRYGYSYLGLKEPFFHLLVPVLSAQFADVFPEVQKQEGFIQRVILEEETSFLKTLDTGLKKLEEIKNNLLSSGAKTADGKTVFELHDTFGFPPDLTALILKEFDLGIDEKGFEEELEKQKARSRAAAVVATDDWVILKDNKNVEFVGYDRLEATVNIVKYRKVKAKGKEQFQIVLDTTPFYAESGGQVGDTGRFQSVHEDIPVLNTIKENDQIIHITDKLPENTEVSFTAKVDSERRLAIAGNHSATHLLHAALKQVLGDHVNQKGSLVHPDYLRFDFSHFAKVSQEELREIERIVNSKIRENIPLKEQREVPVKEAMEAGATALFGEKYGDHVRVITFDPKYSVELCGGTHIPNTGQIGYFKITTESAVAAGVRRIEAISGEKCDQYIQDQIQLLKFLEEKLGSKNPVQAVDNLLVENNSLKKVIEGIENEKVNQLQGVLRGKIKAENGINSLFEIVEVPNADAMKTLAYNLKNEFNDFFAVLGSEINEKAFITVMISDNLVKEKGLNAGAIVKELAKEIKGGGGGQPFYATAGGAEIAGLKNVMEKAKNYIS